MAILSGENAKVTFGTVPVTFNNTAWKLSLKPNNKDVSNTRDGRKRIRTLGDAEGSFEGFWDDADQNYSDDIAEGQVGTLKLYVDATKFYQLTAIIDDMDIDTAGVDAGIKVSVKFSLESGTVTRPVALV